MIWWIAAAYLLALAALLAFLWAFGAQRREFDSDRDEALRAAAIAARRKLRRDPPRIRLTTGQRNAIIHAGAATGMRDELAERRRRSDHQIAAAVEQWHESSGEVAAGPGTAAVSPLTPSGSHCAVAAGSPDEPHDPEAIDRARVRFTRLHEGDQP